MGRTTLLRGGLVCSGEQLAATLGAPLARLEARVMFEELVPELARCELAGEDVRVRSTLIPGIKYMPVRFAA